MKMTEAERVDLLGSFKRPSGLPGAWARSIGAAVFTWAQSKWPKRMDLLTRREIQCLDVMIEFERPEASKDLGISKATLEVFVCSAMRKMDFPTCQRMLIFWRVFRFMNPKKGGGRD